MPKAAPERATAVTEAETFVRIFVRAFLAGSPLVQDRGVHELPTGGRRGMKPVTVDGGKGTVELGADGVIHLIWEPRVRIEIEDAQAAMAAVNLLAGDNTYPMLVDMATTENVSRDARSVFSIPCAANRIAL